MVTLIDHAIIMHALAEEPVSPCGIKVRLDYAEATAGNLPHQQAQRQYSVKQRFSMTSNHITPL